jgi:hypothetical protein
MVFSKPLQMHIRVVIITACLFMVSCKNRQRLPPLADIPALQTTVKEQAQKMGEALMAKDYSRFVDFTHPAVVKKMGGKDEMIGIIRSQMDEATDENFAILKCEFGAVSEIVKLNNTLQCTLPQTLEMKAPGGKVITTSTLIGFTENNGGNWFFLDADDRKILELEKEVPGLKISRELVIPKDPAPRMVKDE